MLLQLSIGVLGPSVPEAVCILTVIRFGAVETIFSLWQSPCFSFEREVNTVVNTGLRGKLLASQYIFKWAPVKAIHSVPPTTRGLRRLVSLSHLYIKPRKARNTGRRINILYIYIYIYIERERERDYPALFANTAVRHHSVKRRMRRMKQAQYQ